jgi:hypothetical protein
MPGEPSWSLSASPFRRSPTPKICHASSRLRNARSCRDVVRRHKSSGHYAARMSIICATLGKPTTTVVAGHITPRAQANQHRSDTPVSGPRRRLSAAIRRRKPHAIPEILGRAYGARGRTSPIVRADLRERQPLTTHGFKARITLADSALIACFHGITDSCGTNFGSGLGLC